MRIFLIFILLNIFNSIAQDTIKGDVDLKIYKGDKIIQREFKSSKNYYEFITHLSIIGGLLALYKI